MSSSPSETVKRSSLQRQRQRGKLTREAKALISIGLGLAFCAALFFVIIRPSMNVTPRAGQSQSSEALVREDSVRWGPPDAKATLVEFLDYECPACAAMAPTIERIKQEYGDRVQVVIRSYPLHRNSVLAAKAADAAGRQGKYEGMHTMLFEQQRAWANMTQPPTEIFVDYANRLGLNVEQFRRDLNDPALDAKVRRDEADAKAVGATGTPTFFLNGTNLGGVMQYEQLKSRIDAALR